LQKIDTKRFLKNKKLLNGISNIFLENEQHHMRGTSLSQKKGGKRALDLEVFQSTFQVNNL